MSPTYDGDSDPRCVEEILVDSPGVVESPDYPRGYPSLAHCVWVFRAANPGMEVRLDLMDVQVRRGVLVDAFDTTKIKFYFSLLNFFCRIMYNCARP